MIIDRHNYETYFLLYADRELDAATAAAVEAFAAAHPDLQQELQLLLQTRSNDAPQLDSTFKAALLREVPETEALEPLLLYLDGELPAADAEKTEQALRSDNKLNQQWALLQKTKLHPDTTIVFPNKETLYRHRTPIHRFWQPGYKRLAAAAAVMALLLTAWWLLQPDATRRNNFAGKLPSHPTPAAPASNNALPAGAADHIAAAAKKQIKSAAVTATAAAIPPSQTTPVRPSSTAYNATFQNTTENTSAVPTYHSTVAPQDLTVTPVTKTATEKNNSTASNLSAVGNVPPVATAATTDIAYYTGNGTDNYVDDTDAPSNDMNDAIKRRSGLIGFLKKARRTIERRTGIATGDGPLRLAVFTIHTQ
ncbi:MAG: hypothetical protein ACK4E8_04235 [Lacibacter sp.]